MFKETERRKNPFLDDRFSRSKNIAAGNVTTSSSHTTDVNIFPADQNDDDDNLASDSMTASYSEISFHSNYPATGGGGAPASQPPALTAAEVREENSNYYEEKLSDNEDDDADATYPGKSGKNRYKGRERPASLVCDKSFPYNLEGIVSKEGDMTNFVTENLEYKIKLSSPVTKKETNQPGGSSKNSTPSGLIPRQFMLPHQPPEIDSNVLNDIEIEAQYLAASVDNLTENLCNLLHSISSITADNVEIHKNAVNKLTDSMDANIKSMYTIMAKTEEISKSMRPTEQLATRIREIKRLVDMLEGTL